MEQSCTKCNAPKTVSCFVRKPHCFNCRFWCEKCVPFRKQRKKPVNLARKLQIAHRICDDVAIFSALKKGANPAFMSGWKEKFLQLAVRRNNVTFANEMIKLGADVSVRDEWRDSLLYTAVRYKSVDVVRILLDDSLRPSMTDINLSLERACDENHMEIVTMLIEKGADVNYRQSKDPNILLVKHRAHDFPPLNALLYNTIQKRRYNEENTYKIAELLIDHGASMDYDCNGYTPIHLAYSCEKYKVIHLLISRCKKVKKLFQKYVPYLFWDTMVLKSPQSVILALDRGLLVDKKTERECPRYVKFRREYIARKQITWLCLFRDKGATLLNPDFLPRDVFNLICKELFSIEI